MTAERWTSQTFNPSPLRTADHVEEEIGIISSNFETATPGKLKELIIINISTAICRMSYLLLVLLDLTYFHSSPKHVEQHTVTAFLIIINNHFVIRTITTDLQLLKHLFAALMWHINLITCSSANFSSLA